MEDVFKYRSVTEWNGYIVEFEMPSTDGNMRLTEIVLGADSCLEATKDAIDLSWVHSEFALARTPPVLEIIRTLFGGDGKEPKKFPLIVDGVYYIMSLPTDLSVKFKAGDWFIGIIPEDHLNIGVNYTTRTYDIEHGKYYYWLPWTESGFGSSNDLIPPIQQATIATRHIRNPRFRNASVDQAGVSQEAVTFGNRPYSGAGWFTVGDWDSDGEPWVKAEWQTIDDVYCSNYRAPNNWQNCAQTANNGICRQTDFQEPLIISNKNTGRCSNPDYLTKILCEDAEYTWNVVEIPYSNKELVFPASDDVFILQPLKEQVCVGFGPMLKQDPDPWYSITRYIGSAGNGIYGAFMAVEPYVPGTPAKVICTKIEFRGDFSILEEFVDLTWPLPPTHPSYTVWGSYGPYQRWPCGVPGAQYVQGFPSSGASPSANDPNCETEFDNPSLNSKTAQAVRIGVTGEDLSSWQSDPEGIFNYRDLHLDYEPAQGGWGFKAVYDPTYAVSWGPQGMSHWWDINFHLKSVENWPDNDYFSDGCSNPAGNQNEFTCFNFFAGIWTQPGKCLITSPLWAGGPGADWMQESSFTTREMCMEYSQTLSQWDDFYFMWIEESNTWRNIYHSWEPSHSGWWLPGGGPYHHWGIGDIVPYAGQSHSYQWKWKPNLDLDSTYVLGSVQYHTNYNVLTSENQRIYPKKHIELKHPQDGVEVLVPDVPTEFTMYHQDTNWSWGNGEEVGRSTIPMWLTNSVAFPDKDKMMDVCEDGRYWGESAQGGDGSNNTVAKYSLEDCHFSGKCLGHSIWDNDELSCRSNRQCNQTGLDSWYGPSSQTCTDGGFYQWKYDDYLHWWDNNPWGGTIGTPQSCWNSTTNLAHYSCFNGGHCNQGSYNCMFGNYGEYVSYNNYYNYPCNGINGSPANNSYTNQGTACHCYQGRWTNKSKCLGAGVCERWFYSYGGSNFSTGWHIIWDTVGNHSNKGSNIESYCNGTLATELANWCAGYQSSPVGNWGCSHSETRWFSDNNTWVESNNEGNPNGGEFENHYNGTTVSWQQPAGLTQSEQPATWHTTVMPVIDEMPLEVTDPEQPTAGEYVIMQYPPHLFVSATTYGGYSDHCENGAFNNETDCVNGGSNWILAVEYPAAQPVEAFGYTTQNRPEGALIRWKPPEYEKNDRDKFYPRPSHFRIYRSPWVSPEGLSLTGSDYEAGIWRLAGEVACTSEDQDHFFTDTRADLIKLGVSPYDRVYYRVTSLWKNWNLKAGYVNHIFGRGQAGGPDLNHLTWDPRRYQHWNTYGVEHWIDEAQAFELLDGMCSTTNLSDDSTKLEAGCLGHGTCTWPQFNNDEVACTGQGHCSDTQFNNDETTCINLPKGICSDPQFNNDHPTCVAQGLCVDANGGNSYSSDWNNSEVVCTSHGGLCTGFYENIGTSSNPLYAFDTDQWHNNEQSCFNTGSCTAGWHITDQAECIVTGGIWTQATWTPHTFVNHTFVNHTWESASYCDGNSSYNATQDDVGCNAEGICSPDTQYNNDETSCLAGTCTDTMYTDEASCIADGSCSPDGSQFTESNCLNAGTCSDPAYNGWLDGCLYMSGECYDENGVWVPAFTNDGFQCLGLAGSSPNPGYTWVANETYTSTNTWTWNTWTASGNTWTSAGNTWNGPVWTHDNYTWTVGAWTDSTSPYGDNPIAPFDFSSIETPAGGIIPNHNPATNPFTADLSTSGWSYNPYEVNTFRYAGYFRAPETGEYTFQVVSKTSSYLWLGENGESMTTLVGYRDHTNNLSGVPGQHSSGVEFRNGYIDLVAGEVYPLLAYFSSNWMVGQTVFKIRVHYPSGEWNDGGIGLDNDGNDIGEWKYAQYEMMPGDMSPTGGVSGQQSANGQNCEGIESGFYNIVTNSQSEITGWDVPDDTVAPYSFYTE